MTSKVGLEELRRRMREGLAESEAPFSEEELARWAAGELSEDERADLLERLATHPEGLELWRVADRVARGSERLRAELAPEESEKPVPSRPRRRLPRYYALAASWLVAALGLGLWWTARSEVAELRRERDELTAPSAEDVELLPGVAVIELDRLRGEEGSVPVLRLPAPIGDEDLPLLLRLPAGTVRAVEIGLFGAGDARLWSARLEIPDRHRDNPVLLVRLPADSVAPSRRPRLVVVAAAADWTFEMELVLTE